MRPECAFDRHAVDEFRTRPALRRREHDYWPAWPITAAAAAAACALLDTPDLLDGLIECRRHQLMHGLGLVALDENRRPTVALQQLLQLGARNAREYRGVGD